MRGPADRLLSSLGATATASGVASLYADFRDSIARDPLNAPALAGLGTALVRRNRLSDAVDIHRHAVALNAAISSVSGIRGDWNQFAYNATKGALNAMVQSLALDLGAHGVRVNAVAPAVVKTRFAGALYEGREEEVASAYPLKRLGEPEDIAPVAVFLASEDAHWVTGESLRASGGVRGVGY